MYFWLNLSHNDLHNNIAAAVVVAAGRSRNRHSTPIWNKTDKTVSAHCALVSSNAKWKYTICGCDFDECRWKAWTTTTISNHGNTTNYWTFRLVFAIHHSVWLCVCVCVAWWRCTVIPCTVSVKRFLCTYERNVGFSEHNFISTRATHRELAAFISADTQPFTLGCRARTQKYQRRCTLHISLVTIRTTFVWLEKCFCCVCRTHNSVAKRADSGAVLFSLSSV